MTKRSPILGYNHNVRYRGLVFHVQTEDSGLLSPHLFTHLFHAGVIVSTRKLVYDPGANEEAIKSLMQAQHKAVMKDLKKGNFDDKIDQYLGGTPGLEPSGKSKEPAVEEPPPPPAPAPDPVDAAPTMPVTAAAAATIPTAALDAVAVGTAPTIDVSQVEITKPRTKTADRGSPPRRVPPPPPPLEDDAPTLTGSAASALAAEVRAAQPVVIQPKTAMARTTTSSGAAPASRPIQPTPGRPIPAIRDFNDFRGDDEPELTLEDDGSGRTRMPRDTTVEVADRSDGVPRSEVRPPSQPITLPRKATPGAVAAALPPLPRPTSRPSLTPPPVVARPLSSDGKPKSDQDVRDSDSVEVYAAAPPSAEPPPGERSERHGTYSVNRKDKSEGIPLREKTGKIKAIPSGLSPPRAPQPERPPPPPERPATAPVRPGATRPAPGQPPARPTPPLRETRTPDANATQPTPRMTAPIIAQSGVRTPPAGSNVVMTRPAVIVGAPPKPPPQPPRVRKAREDEGRGFGQGLISEKSLDEVILAYLSEDADDK